MTLTEVEVVTILALLMGAYAGSQYVVYSLLPISLVGFGLLLMLSPQLGGLWVALGLGAIGWLTCTVAYLAASGVLTSASKCTKWAK